MHNKFKHGAFEGATVYNRFAVKLGGFELLEENDDINLPDASQDTLISKVVGYEYRFLYLIQEVLEKTVTRYERGIGYIVDVDDHTFLQRDTPLEFGSLDDSNLYRVGQRPIRFDSNSYLRVYSVAPANLSEALSTPHSVLASLNSPSPSAFPVALEENTVLGRVNDEVQPIGKDELKDIIEFDDSALSALESTQKQMTLKVRRLDLSRKNAFVSAPYIRLMPDCYTSSQRPPSQQGAIIYNTETHSLEFYDGESWKTLTHSDSGDK
jgi:hypothetical protein